MRAWKESLGDAFQAPELGSAVRALFTSDGRGGRGKGSKPGSQDYMRELLTLAADGQVALDGKAGALQCSKLGLGPLAAGMACSPLPPTRLVCQPCLALFFKPHRRAAAYLVWGAAKAQLRGSDPSVQRIMPLVFEHIDSMRVSRRTCCFFSKPRPESSLFACIPGCAQPPPFVCYSKAASKASSCTPGLQANDMSSLVWAMGLLGIRPSAEQRALLHDRCGQRSWHVGGCRQALPCSSMPACPATPAHAELHMVLLLCCSATLQAAAAPAGRGGGRHADEGADRHCRGCVAAGPVRRHCGTAAGGI